jgi:GR25 family glycosyltransferase involved in LPS biosynthesis
MREKLFILIAIIILSLTIYFNINTKENMINNYINGIDIIYWINLDRSKDRFNEMEILFKDDVFQNIPTQRIKAYDAKNNPKSVFDKVKFETRLENDDTVYGCLLSHLEAIKTFNDSKYDVALICEDDINLEYKKYWKKSIKQIMDEAPNDWDIIMLNYTITDEHKYNNWDNVKEDYIKDITSSCVSYIINKKGSKKLIDSTYKNDKYYLVPTINTHTSDAYIYKLTNTYVYKYPMFTYNTDIPSTISNTHININLLSKNKIESQYDKLYPEYKNI